MSVADQISRISKNRNEIRDHLVDLHLATALDNLDTLTTAICAIQGRKVNASVKEGESVTIPAGYHDGTGVVTGVSGGGNYTLQSKIVTPTKKTIAVTNDDGYYGLSDVTVNPIPDAYQNVTSVTAKAEDVLSEKIYVDSIGNVVTGMMTNNGAIKRTLTTSVSSVAIEKGYHNGSGTVSIVLEDKTATPTKAQQSITPTDGSVLSSVTVEPIPVAYQDVTSVTATADDVVVGSSFVDTSGAIIHGTIPKIENNTTVLDTTSDSYTIEAGVHNGLGVVKIVPEVKSATPSKASQSITPTLGKVLSRVTVSPIPDKYQDVSGVTAGAENVVEGNFFVDSSGKLTEGTIPVVTSSQLVLNTEKTSTVIESGLHDGLGTVSISLEPKTATPTKLSQDVTPSPGKVLSKVTVSPIPDAYQDVSKVTATSGDVAEGAVFVSKTGEIITGSVPKVEAKEVTLDTIINSVTIDGGIHDGTGVVKVVPESKTATPTKSIQTILPSDGMVIASVKIDAIPKKYQDVTSVTATKDDVILGTSFVDATGAVVHGTIPKIVSETSTLDTVTTSKTISKGFHDGLGIVKIVTETKSATPTKDSQSIVPSLGKVLSGVTVNPIPDAYQDVSGVTATAGDVLSGISFVNTAGTLVEGTIARIAPITTTLDTSTTSFTIENGYHDGTGKVNILTETKSTTPTKSSQSITPTKGKVLSKVTVSAIPDNYQDISGVTAIGTDVLVGKKFIGSDGLPVTGTMPNNGDTSKTINGLDIVSVIIPAGYTSGGTVTFTDEIETLLAAI